MLWVKRFNETNDKAEKLITMKSRLWMLNCKNEYHKWIIVRKRYDSMSIISENVFYKSTMKERFKESKCVFHKSKRL